MMLGMTAKQGLEVVECASQREYFVTDVFKGEMVVPGAVRYYCGTRRGNTMEVQFTVVMPANCVPTAARFCIEAAALVGVFQTEH